MQNARPRHEGPNAVQTQSPNEDDFVAVVAEQPVGVAQRCEWVGAEVGGLQAGGSRASDSEGVLEVFVEGVEEAVGEAPEEEEDCY